MIYEIRFSVYLINKIISYASYIITHSKRIIFVLLQRTQISNLLIIKRTKKWDKEPPNIKIAAQAKTAVSYVAPLQIRRMRATLYSPQIEIEDLGLVHKI